VRTLDRHLFIDWMWSYSGPCFPPEWRRAAYAARRQVLEYETMLMLLCVAVGLPTLVVLSRAIRAKSRGS
jgi:hypothetical protein